MEDDALHSGDCFRVAIQVAGELAQLGLRPTIVHGTPINTGPIFGGQRYWHAWVEVKTAEEGWVVIDYSNGHRTQMLRGDYYRAGRLHDKKRRTVWRYTIREALDALDRLGHNGPWPDGWEEICRV